MVLDCIDSQSLPSFLHWVLSKELLTLLLEFVCKTYASTTSLCKVSDLRLLSVFMVKKGDVDSSQLPPCQIILMLHAMQAEYQVCIWKRCLKQETDTPIQEGHGWMIEDSQIVNDWMQGLPVPQVMKECLHVNAVDCAKSLIANVLVMHWHVCWYERISYVIK